MKEQKNHYIKRKKFFKKSYFPGGNTSFQAFIKENLKYPEEALKKKKEGSVFLQYSVDDRGNINQITVIKGIGDGCDEEAVRLVKLIKYPPVRNLGVRVKTTMKSKIPFKLPVEVQEIKTEPLNVNYVVSPAKKINSPKQKPQTIYSYQIKLKY